MDTQETTIGVWIVEDNQRYREGLQRVIEKTSGLHCSGTFTNCEEVLETIVQDDHWEYPGVVLMDITFNQPGRADHISGIDGIAHLKAHFPDVPIVMLTGHDSTEYIFQAFKSGASGYLHKKARMDDIIDAIRVAHRGGMLTPPAVASKMLGFFREADPRWECPLSDRELQIVELMAQGKKRKEMANELYLSTNTIDSHLSNIYQKLHVKNGMQAVAKVYGSRLRPKR